MKKYKPYLTRVDLVKNQVERERIQEQEAKRKRKQRIQEQNRQNHLRYQEQLRSEMAARYFHAVQSTGGESFSNKFSVAFDGSNDHILTDSNYTQLDGQNKATFSMWIKPTLASTDFALYVPSASDRAYTIGVFNTGLLRMQMQSSGLYVTTNTGVLSANVWQHILICIDLTLAFSSRGAIFVNGVDVTSGNNLNLTTFVTSDGSLQFSGRNISSHLYYEGQMDEIAIWRGIDLRDDVATIYSNKPTNLNNNGLTAPTTWYRMGDGDTFPTITDNGSGGNDATMTNMDSADIVEDTPG